MVAIPLGTDDWQSEEQDLGRIKLRNAYIAENPFSSDGVSRYVRPSLEDFISVGAGPISGIWQQNGSLDGQWLVVSGDELYSVFEGGGSTFLGNIPGGGFCDFAGNEERVVIVRDGIAYYTDGLSLAAIAMPDDQPVGSVDQIDGAFLLTIRDSFRFYWMLPGETAPDPLNFASAERLPDAITKVSVISDEIWFIGTDSVEVWAQTGDPDIPYTRIAGRSYTNGCDFRDSVVKSSFSGYPCLLWVTNNKEVVLTQGQPNKISTDSVEELLKSSTNLRAWGFRRKRSDFYILTADELTLVFNITAKSWSRWDSFGFDNFRSHLGIQIGDRVYGGDSTTGRVFALLESESDFGTDPIVAQISGFVPLSGKQTPCASVNLRINSGWSGGYLIEPVVELRWSDDYGFSWSQPLQASMGTMGSYTTDVTFRSLGLIERPGRLFEVSFSGLQNFRIDYATMNEV